MTRPLIDNFSHNHVRKLRATWDARQSEEHKTRNHTFITTTLELHGIDSRGTVSKFSLFKQSRLSVLLLVLLDDELIDIDSCELLLSEVVAAAAARSNSSTHRQ